MKGGAILLIMVYDLSTGGLMKKEMKSGSLWKTWKTWKKMNLCTSVF